MLQGADADNDALLLQSKAVAEHVGVLLDADEKFLIFSHHADMHNAVEAAVRGYALMLCPRHLL